MTLHLPPERRFVRLQEFARVHRISLSTIYRHPESYPRITKVGGIAVVMISDLEAWERRLTNRPE